MTAIQSPPLPALHPSWSVPPLENGDHLTRQEFLRRYHAMPEVKKAELIEGVVYMPSPVSIVHHGSPHSLVIGWMLQYVGATPGTQMGNNSTVELEIGENCPQPDGQLRVLPEFGGQTRTSPKGYVMGCPEFGAEVASSTASYDLHEKLHAFERNGMQEYLVWRVIDRTIDWFRLRAGVFQPLAPDGNGILKSEAFPGLWLDVSAFLREDVNQALAVLHQGLASPEHQAFVAELQNRRTK